MIAYRAGWTDPLRIAALVARCAAPSCSTPTGVTRTKVLGNKRTNRKLHDALPGEKPSRTALWAFLRPILPPRRLGEH